MEKVMQPESIWQQLDTLPTEAKREVIDFIAFQQIRYERPVFVKKAKRSKLKNEPFIGMWKDRDDMSDSVAWVRELRRQKFVANM
jgi:hypothetical protein